MHISTYAELVLVLIELILLKLAFDEPVYNDILLFLERLFTITEKKISHFTALLIEFASLILRHHVIISLY